MKPNWHGNLVLICEKCGSKLKQGEENPSLVLKNQLKKRLLEKSLWGPNRVVTTSCLDICPEGKVAVAFVSDRTDLETHAEAIDPLSDRERILVTIMERSNPTEKNS